MNQGTNLGSQIGRWIILAALVAVLGALLFLLPGVMVQAQEIGESYQYAENVMDPVVTFTANDPEDVTPIVWSIFGINDDGTVNNGTVTLDQDIDGDGDNDVVAADVVDGGDFTVSSNGALSFTSPPNFEAPSGEGATSNTYKVVVQASDGGVTSWVNWFKVTVTVTDLEEDGTVVWDVDPDGDGDSAEDDQTLRQFQAGAVLDASLTDPDNVVDGTPTGAIEAGINWKWYRSSSNTGPWTEIFNETAAMYTASDEADSNDVGMHLRALATYTDRRGGSKHAEFVSYYPVQEAREINTHPEFPSATATRTISEGPSGRDVGGPVTASDADNDVLNYSLGGTHSDFFKVNPATGQISTIMLLNYESPDTDATDNVYTVTIKATDSSGDATDDTDQPEDITVMITVTDVNEKPEFPAAGVNPANPPAGMLADHLEDEAILDLGTYTATDPEGGEITLTLSGSDMSKFELKDLDTPAPGRKILALKEKPDFENPGDSNGDNIYEVTVEASDTVKTESRSMTVKVTDADEDGEVTLSTQDAVVGKQITAMLADSDGAVARMSWEWQSTMPGAGQTCAELDTDPTWEAVDDGSEAAYTPTAGDSGDCLRAMVEYMDRTTTEDDADDPDDQRSRRRTKALLSGS